MFAKYSSASVDTIGVSSLGVDVVEIAYPEGFCLRTFVGVSENGRLTRGLTGVPCTAAISCLVRTFRKGERPIICGFKSSP